MTPEIRKLAKEDVERMIKEAQQNDREHNEAKAIVTVTRSLRTYTKHLKRNLECHNKNDLTEYPILVKEYRLQRARYFAAMKRYLPLIKPRSSQTPQPPHH